MITYLIIGVAVVFNIIVLRFKYNKGRYADMLVDAGILVSLSLIFGGTYSGMVVSTVASALISLYLYMFPPKFTSQKKYGYS